MSAPLSGPSKLVYPLNDIALSSLAPNSGAAAAQVAITANGAHYNGGCVIYFNGVAQATTFLSTKQLRATVNVGAAGQKSVYVYDPSTGRKTKPLSFAVA